MRVVFLNDTDKNMIVQREDLYPEHGKIVVPAAVTVVDLPDEKDVFVKLWTNGVMLISSAPKSFLSET